MKQAIIIRSDLKMGKGKIASQAAHASISAFMNAPGSVRDRWMSEGMSKIVLKVPNESELLKICSAAKRAKLPCELIHDRGLTQVEPGSATAVGIGPADDEDIDRITSKLKLL